MINLSCDVAIIGAGLAGLSAADLLKSKGLKVQVIEAQGRAGGRVMTHYLPMGTDFELGAFCFGNAEQPLMNYINRFALPIIKNEPMDIALHFRRHQDNASERGRFIEEKKKEAVFQLLNQLLPQLKKIEEDISFAEALKRVGASNKAIEAMQATTLPGLFGDSFQEISAHAALAFLQQYEECTSFYTIQGGNQKLPQALGQELQEEILYEHTVRKIEHLNDKCILHADDYKISAKRVIFTIPLPAMEKICIEPPFSARKIDVMRNTLYTSCTRVSVVAPSSVISAKPRGGVFLITNYMGWFREQSAFQENPEDKTVINVSLTGEPARKLATLAPKEWQKSIDDILSTISPKWDPNLATYFIHIWKNGGYSIPKTGRWAEQSILREKEGLCHFAGEHTSEKFASMNGAIESGLRAANEILVCEILS